MQKTVERAASIAAEQETRCNTGHLLLAMMDGDRTASNLLKLRGLTRGKIRSCLRNMGTEQADAVREVIDKSRQIADSFKVAGQPSPLHLLAALTGSKDCIAAQVLEKLGLDVKAIRTQALRCLTGVTEEHGAQEVPKSALSSRPEEALPMADQLRHLTSRIQTGRTAPEDPQQKSANAKDAPGDLSRNLSLSQMTEVGRDLELKQRRKRTDRPGPLESTGISPGSARSHAARFARRPFNRVSVRKKKVKEAKPGFDLAADEFPLLNSIGRNLTLEAAAGRLDDVIGRTREMERMTDVLNKRRANSPCLVGAPGVGKTALVEGLALRLANQQMSGLEDRVIIEIRPPDLLQGTSLRGALAERLGDLRKEVARAQGHVILFFDEIHTLLSSNEGQEAVQDLKTALSRGELPCICATTDAEYAKQIRDDPALARRITPIEITEPSEEETVEILRAVQSAYSDHHQVTFTHQALISAVRLTSRYIADRALPDKAVALLDLAGARARRFDQAQVGPEDVAQVLADQIGVSPDSLTKSGRERLLDLEGELARRIVGHGHVLAALGETLRRNAAGFRTRRPIGSFLFLGPTGVGKTETAKALASFLFPGGNGLVRLDMSEFAESHAVARLVGAPPGYLGHEDGGQLTEAVRRSPYCLILLDEIEKAHRDVLQTLLQVLDDGRLTDGRGRTVVFENTVVVMTSNLGSDLRIHRRPVGFGAPQSVSTSSDLCDAILDAARSSLPIELWNRIDEPLVFGPLDRQQVAEIAIIMLDEASRQLFEEHGVVLEPGDGAVQTLVNAGGYDPDLGARPMRRTIQRLVEGPVAKMILNGDAKKGDRVCIVGCDQAISFEVSQTSDNPHLDVQTV